MRLFRNVEFLADGSRNPEFKEGEELCWTETLAHDDPLVWSRDPEPYVRFGTHGEAETRAIAIEKAHGIHCHAHNIERDPTELESRGYRPEPPPTTLVRDIKRRTPRKETNPAPHLPDNVRLPYRDD